MRLDGSDTGTVFIRGGGEGRGGNVICIVKGVSWAYMSKAHVVFVWTYAFMYNNMFHFITL